MLRRIRSRIDAPEPIRTVRRDVGWTTVAPGIERKILFDDGSTMSWLVRLAPGADLPEHVHEDGAEECLIVEGEMCLNGECYRAGDYMVAAPGSRHMQTRTTTGATMFLRTPSPGRSAATGAGRG
jgi:quercetin dioxygenase-like cupin family protein